MAQTPFEPAVLRADIDVEACMSIADGEGKAVEAAVLDRVLELVPITSQTEHWHRQWAAGQVGGDRAGPQGAELHSIPREYSGVATGSLPAPHAKTRFRQYCARAWESSTLRGGSE
jgi:hypothetical protein